MTSDLMRQTNRANAARSTGPRTRTGRARAARNARRHGLSLPVAADPALAPEVSALAHEIAGEGASVARHAAAVRIAEAQIDLLRVRRVRQTLMAEMLADVAGRDGTVRLLRVDRYERRALSRRKLAIREFDEAADRIGKQMS